MAGLISWSSHLICELFSILIFVIGCTALQHSSLRSVSCLFRHDFGDFWLYMKSAKLSKFKITLRDCLLNYATYIIQHEEIQNSLRQQRAVVDHMTRLIIHQSSLSCEISLLFYICDVYMFEIFNYVKH